MLKSCLDPLIFLFLKTFKLFGCLIFWHWAYLMTRGYLDVTVKGNEHRFKSLYKWESVKKEKRVVCTKLDIFLFIMNSRFYLNKKHHSSVYVCTCIYWIGLGLGLWCLKPLSTILQLYRGGQLYWCIGGGNVVPGNKPPAARHWQTLSHNVVSSTPRHLLNCYNLIS